jgi:hypothetical protein
VDELTDDLHPEIEENAVVAGETGGDETGMQHVGGHPAAFQTAGLS